MTGNHEHPLPTQILESIRQFDTCTIANAIEKFSVRLRNVGYTRPGLQCVTGGSPRLLGYAATARIRIIDFCQSPGFSTVGLLEVIKTTDQGN